MADLDKNKNHDLNQKNDTHEPDANRDPLSGQPGAHPVGTGIGAAGIGTVGAVVGGVIGGPVGAVIGSAVGAVAGGLVGKSAAESVDPTVEDDYWRNNYNSRPYVEPGHTYDDYKPAYQTGYEGYGLHANTGRKFDEIEPDLRNHYETRQGNAGLGWDKAKHAARDAWDKVENKVKGSDSGDRDISGSNLTDRNLSAQNTQQVNLYEERLIADKTRVKTGEVNVGKRVETETTRVQVPVEKERIVVERTTPTNAGTAVPAGEADFREGEVARVEIYEEQADIHKEAVLREEVKIRKEVERDTVQAEEQIRREELDIDDQGRGIIDRSNPRI
ncbi:YsnF/AvaK domain-containing protein [Trichocoleus sp. FACHB-262]|uniref:YsnF/AvaK domain-containing protein n=1 Tax=Trichocoleus sp. FACHB-262 TaxID=2692869 RepID=UPI001F552ECA|nr:YsnF/AvaK domain-containing protein [Trichocoleus sp. FACHB-262]